MKPNFLLVLFCLTGFFSFAQGHYNGQYAIGAQYGATKDGNAYNLNVQRLIGDNYFGARVDLNYYDKTNKLTVVETEIVPHKILSLGIAGTYSLEEVLPHPLYAQIHLGAQYSNENFNEGKSISSKGLQYTAPNENVFGLYTGIEIELSLLKFLSITGTAQTQRMFNSDVDKSIYFLGGGLKFNL